MAVTVEDEVHTAKPGAILRFVMNQISQMKWLEPIETGIALRKWANFIKKPNKAMVALLMAIAQLLKKINSLNWASLPILISAATLIFTYQTSVFEKDKAQFERLNNYLNAVQVELVLMAPWTKESYHDASLASYMETNQHFEWYNPDLSLYSFSFTNIHNSLSEFLDIRLNPELLATLINLDSSLQRLFEIQSRQSRFAFAFSDLYEKGMVWFEEMKNKYPKLEHQIDKKYFPIIFEDVDARLRHYLIRIYEFNYQMRVCGIGGSDRKLADCAPQEIGANDLWEKAVFLTDKVAQEIKPPLRRNYLVLFFLIVSWFVFPSICSCVFLKRFEFSGQ